MENSEIVINEDTVENLMDKFENAAQVNEHGAEFWYARDLQKLLGYIEWRNFEKAIDKAKIACEASSVAINEHLVGVNRMFEIGNGAETEREDFQLSRYVCYLIAQNGDPRKEEIAFAQTYFAMQTRKQELAEQEEREFKNLSENKKRVYLRNEMKDHNKTLASAAKKAGVVNGYDYANFQNAGYKGLYNGLDKNNIQRKKGLTQKQDILDHMGSTELAANLFRATQTEEKLVRDNVKGKDNANKTHFEVGRKVRQTISEIGGTMPEKLPVAEDVKKVEKKLKKEAIGSC